MRIKKAKWMTRIAAFFVIGAILFVGGIGLAQEDGLQAAPVEEAVPLPQEDEPGDGAATVQSAVLDVEFYPWGSSQEPDEDDILQMVCSTPDAIIFYTTDGNDPTEGSVRYDEENPPRIGDIPEAYTPMGFTVRARAFLNGEESANITELQIGQVVCRSPEFMPDDGIYPAGTQIALSCSTPGAEIFYSIEGVMPDTLYVAPFALTDDAVISAYAVCSGYGNSREAVGVYQVGEVDAYEPNDTFEMATQLTLPIDIRATISNRDDLDYFAFSMPADRRLSITLVQPETEERAFIYALKLFDEEGNKIDVAAEEGTGKITRYLSPGNYYVLVSGGENKSYSAAEYALMIETLPMDAYDFSEYNLVNSAFHPNSPFHFYSRNILSAGTIYTAVACLSRGDGYLVEQQDPYILYYDDDDIADRNESYYHTGKAAYKLKDVVMLPPRADALDNAHYKKAIYTYGALYGGILESPEYYTENKAYFYHPEEVREGSGHAITIIGWDDSIPKENFRVTYDGQDYEPVYDGAFLAKNSYGEQTGKDGCFYISYCSAYFSNNPAATMIARPARADENVLYMHDPYGYTGFYSKSEPPTGKEIWAKNVFTASSGQVLKSVSFYAFGMDQEYDIFVDTGDGNIQVASGINRYAGYYTVDIEMQIPLQKGEVFSVTVRQKNANGLDVTAALEETVKGYAPDAAAQKGQSFLSFDGKTWQDISQTLEANNCIKAYAYDKDAEGYVVVTEEAENAEAVISGALELQMEEAAMPMGDAFAGGTPAQEANLPPAFDLRNIGAVTSIKNQGNPPTCWTFATMGSTESYLLKAESGFDTGVSISLDAAERQLFLDGNSEGYATATVRQTGGSGKVYWQFEGDMHAIDIKSRISGSEERAVLFSAKQEGSVTATAVSVDDGTKSAQIVFEIKKTGGAPAPVPTETPAAETVVAQEEIRSVPRTGDARSIANCTIVLLSAGGMAVLFAAARGRKTGKKA